MSRSAEASPGAWSRDEERHQATMRALGKLRDSLAPRWGVRELYRAAALAGYNANPDPAVGSADPGMKARWAEEDAEALLEVGSDGAGV